MILSNGRIYTLDADDRVVDTLVVRADRVVFAGRRVDVNAPAGEAEIDLGGRAVLPGLVDAHGHLMYLARHRLTLDVTGLPSEAACAERAAGRAASTRAGEWITGRGWDQNRWPGGRFPTRASLDRAVPRHPVALVRVDGHATWVNTPALRAAGIDRHTPDPPGGRLERDDQGEPTGILIDTAQELVRRVEPRPSPAQMDDAIRAAVADCLAVGLTGVHEMGADLDALAAYRRLAAAGAFPFRNHVALRGADPAAWQAALDEGPARLGDGRVSVGSREAHGGRRARLPWRRAPRAILRRPGQHRAAPAPARRARGARPRRGRARLPGLRPRDRRPREHARPRRARGGDPRPARASRAGASQRFREPILVTGSSTPRSWRSGTSPDSARSACSRACSPPTAPRTCPGRPSASAPTGCPAPMPGARSSRRGPSSPAAPTSRSSYRIRSTGSTRR